MSGITQFKRQETVKRDPAGPPFVFLMKCGSPPTFIQSEVGAVSSWETGKAILGARTSKNKSKTEKSLQCETHGLIAAHSCDGSAEGWEHLLQLLSCQ